MDRWTAMRVFVKVAETESFAKTARHLHMSAAAVTRTIAALEELIGARLFVRTTRSVKTTEAGKRYLNDCRRILSDIAEAESAAAGHYAEPSGTLAVTASAMFGRIHVLPVVMAYLDAYPGMRARTLFVDRTVNVLDEGIDVAVRIGHLPDSGFTAVQVGSVRRVICGSPDYLRAHGTPATPGDLKRHRIVASSSAWSLTEWRFGDGQRVVIDPILQCNTNESVIAAAKAGWGLTRVPIYQIAPALQAGTLAIALDEFEEPALPIHILYPEGRQAPAKVRAFVDLAVSSLRRSPFLN